MISSYAEDFYYKTWRLIKNGNIKYMGAEKINKLFVDACWFNHKDIAQYLYDNGADISYNNNEPFISACGWGNDNIATWLYELGTDIVAFDDKALKEACYYHQSYIVKWLIDIHYKSSGFIHFESYHNFKLEIKELLIGANLVHPRQLNKADLEHYLTYTDGLVPADFDHPNTHKRGQRTKPAPKYFFLIWIYNFKMSSEFMCACYANDLEKVKKLKYMCDENKLNDAFIEVCREGYLDIAKCLYHPSYDINWAFLYACQNGHLHVAKWLYKLGINIAYIDNYVFIAACENGYLNMSKWLYSLGFIIPDQNEFIVVCYFGRIDIVKWLIDIHYKSSGFIHFKSYSNFKLEIKELLIGANLVHPRQLNTADLEHYLTYTDGLVPADFNHPNTRKRGQHTKPAPK